MAVTQDTISPSHVDLKKGTIAYTTTLFRMDRLEKMNREANTMILSLENRVNTSDIESDLRGIELTCLLPGTS